MYIGGNFERGVSCNQCDLERLNLYYSYVCPITYKYSGCVSMCMFNIQTMRVILDHSCDHFILVCTTSITAHKTDMHIHMEPWHEGVSLLLTPDSIIEQTSTYQSKVSIDSDWVGKGGGERVQNC